MRTLALAFAVAGTLLLSVIALELYRIDQSLGYISPPMRVLSALGQKTNAATVPETREQRIERKRRELESNASNFAEWMEAADRVKPGGKSATARQPR